MKTPLRIPLLLSLVATVGLSNCDKQADDAEPLHGLDGKWKLAQRQCFCVPGPTPNETAQFTGTNFAFYRNGQPASTGTFAYVMATVCGQTTQRSGLRFNATTPNIGPNDAVYTINGDTLVLDYGAPCDAPRDTYERIR